MLEHIKINTLEDYFIELKSRTSRGVYFYRINGYSEEIENFILKYYETARKAGVVIEGKIPNPDEKNLSYYSEIMGMDFQMSVDFIATSLKKWLPRMNSYQVDSVASSIYNSLESMRKAGKTENMLKNAYIKFMCWLYYKFERIVNQLGENNIPKILYEGNISNYELMLISILSNAGCDVVLLQYQGDNEYRKLDPESRLSYDLGIVSLQPFPKGFSLKTVREKIQNKINNERLYGTRASIKRCTNAWIKGKGIDDFKQSTPVRGTDNSFFYNCFCRINGAQDKLTYANELYQFQLELKNSKRKVVIVNGSIPKPDMDEIAKIKRSNYTRIDQLIMSLSTNIQYTANIELQRLMVTAFVDVVLEMFDKGETNINKISNKAVYLLCWLERYKSFLFSNWNLPDVGCFIKFGGCKDDTEAAFMQLLAKLPIDVLILNPNLNNKCCLVDKILYEVNYQESLNIDKYPEDNSQIRIGTVAYHAERELDTLMYQDSGIYRNQQYSKANVINLQTMYEEISILWNQEMKYRPSFSTVNGVVNMPVIFAKISGVKDAIISSYWSSIKELLINDTIVVKKAPYIDSHTPNPMKAYVTEFYKNRRLQKSKIKNHPHYPYGILREEMQDFILEKLEAIINQKLIKGIGENGTEYTVISTILNMPKDILRLIQKFDFTKHNPKLVYINVSETVISLEDSILVAFLNLIGFDILFFVPTGYQCVEKHFNKRLMEEHQIGEYMYDLVVPDMKSIPLNNTRPSWRDKIFKRGN